MNYINLNGKIIEKQLAGIPPDNKAFRYGYGLYETMLVQNGEITLAPYHRERLWGGMKVLRFPLLKHLTPEVLENEVLKTVEKNKMAELCRVRMQLYAGNGGLFEPNSNKIDFVIECFSIDNNIIELNEAGLVLGLAEGLSKSTDNLANLKTSNSLIYLMAAQQAKENKWNDALIRNTGGNPIETTIANLFYVKDKTIYTPPLSEGCIAGVMRRKLLETLPQQGYALKEAVISEKTLHDADEVFLTNAIRRIKWVRQINDSTYSNTVTQHIYNTLFH